MANPERGEVRLDVDGTGYKLKLTMTGIVELQRKKGKSFGRLVAAVGDLDFDVIAGILWASLQVYHQRAFKTEQQVLDLIDQDGGLNNLQKYIDVLNQLFEVNKPAEQKASGNEANPQPAQSGGSVERSTSTLEPIPA